MKTPIKGPVGLTPKTQTSKNNYNKTSNKRGNYTTRAGEARARRNNKINSYDLRREAWEKRNLPDLDTREGLELNYYYLIKLSEDFERIQNYHGKAQLAERMKEIFLRSEKIEEDELVRQNEQNDDIMDLGHDVLIPFLSINMPCQYFIEVRNMDDLEKTVNYSDKYPLLTFRKTIMIFSK